MPSPRLAAAASSTRTPQEARIVRLLRNIADAKAAGQVTTTVRLINLEALICILALTEAGLVMAAPIPLRQVA